jgi:hypothetical protein
LCNLCTNFSSRLLVIEDRLRRRLEPSFIVSMQADTFIRVVNQAQAAVQPSIQRVDSRDSHAHSISPRGSVCSSLDNSQTSHASLHSKYLGNKLMRATRHTLALLSSVLLFDIAELWYSIDNSPNSNGFSTKSNGSSNNDNTNSDVDSMPVNGVAQGPNGPESYLCTFVHVMEEFHGQYPDIIAGYYPDHKREHLRSPKLCSYANQSPEGYYWDIKANADEVPEVSAPVRTEFAYKLELPETEISKLPLSSKQTVNSPVAPRATFRINVFIVGFSSEVIELTEAKMKFLNGLGYAIYVSAFDLDEQILDTSSSDLDLKQLQHNKHAVVNKQLIRPPAPFNKNSPYGRYHNPTPDSEASSDNPNVSSTATTPISRTRLADVLPSSDPNNINGPVPTVMRRSDSDTSSDTSEYGDLENLSINSRTSAQITAVSSLTSSTNSTREEQQSVGGSSNGASTNASFSSSSHDHRRPVSLTPPPTTMPPPGFRGGLASRSPNPAANAPPSPGHVVNKQQQAASSGADMPPPFPVPTADQGQIQNPTTPATPATTTDEGASSEQVSPAVISPLPTTPPPPSHVVSTRSPPPSAAAATNAKGAANGSGHGTGNGNAPASPQPVKAAAASSSSLADTPVTKEVVAKGQKLKYWVPSWEPLDDWAFPVSQLPVQIRCPSNLTLDMFRELQHIGDGCNSNIFLGCYQEARVIVKMIKESVAEDDIAAHEFDMVRVSVFTM